MVLRVATSAFVLAVIANAADIRGSVRVERRLTKRNVTAPAGVYQRGVAVELGAEQEDSLAYERSHVAVYLEGNIPSASSKPAQVTIEQKDRRFVPDLVVVPVGSAVSFPNFDPIFHNVFSLSSAKSFDLGNYPKGQTRLVNFPVPGMVAVYCHLHSNMSASIVVTPNAWGTKANGDGSFVLKDVPPGTYKAVAWHKAGGTIRKTLEVKAGADTVIDFVVPYVDVITQDVPSKDPSKKSVAHR